MDRQTDGRTERLVCDSIIHAMYIRIARQKWSENIAERHHPFELAVSTSRGDRPRRPAFRRLLYDQNHTALSTVQALGHVVKVTIESI